MDKNTELISKEMFSFLFLCGDQQWQVSGFRQTGHVTHFLTESLVPFFI